MYMPSFKIHLFINIYLSLLNIYSSFLHKLFSFFRKLHMGSNDACGLTGLDLGLSFSSGKLHKNPPKEYTTKLEKEKSSIVLKYDHVLPSLSLGSGFVSPAEDPGSSVSPAGSSYSNSSAVKRGRGGSRGEDRGSDEDEEASCPRKKLRLTKEQSAVLEDSFKQHTTLNPKQKEALARELKLQARQVEVWFQNRRARTKLKQTEMDCELLRKCCESLTEENNRLHRELQELRALKQLPSTATAASAAVFMHTPAATLSICPSCDKTAANSINRTIYQC